VQRIWAAHGLEPHRVRRFNWTADPDRIIEKINRGHQALASHH
jgi:hypothetical protein